MACWFVDQNATTGWHVPSFTEQAIYGYLTEQGAGSVATESGVAPQIEARLITIAGAEEADQIRDPENDRIYEVQGEPEEHYDKPRTDSRRPLGF